MLRCRLGKEGGINPYEATVGETLPSEFTRNYYRLLLRYLTQVSELDENLLKKEANFPEDHTVIASFFGKKDPTKCLQILMDTINYPQIRV